MRALVRETRLDPASFIYPLFVTHGRGVREPIASMPGQARLSIDQLAAEARELRNLGVRAVMLFGIPASKDAEGSEGYARDGITQQAVRALKDADSELVVVGDVCLCEYTDHGHCGLLTPGGEVDNDASLPLLAETAVSLAEAGADLVAPSDMMDGRVAAIRAALDEAGHEIAADHGLQRQVRLGVLRPLPRGGRLRARMGAGDRRGYQMDPGNVREALREVAADIEEQADIVMVKPALAYLDVIRAVREATDLPVAAYNVSGRVRDGEGGGRAGAGWTNARPSSKR